jgi:Mg2+/Co2+ transporter CorB
MPYISVLEKERPKVGQLLKSHKTNIHKSIASILILNTIANTLGAAAVGAQAESIYGTGAVFYVSIVLTFAILFLSEIIPKTIGAT